MTAAVVLTTGEQVFLLVLAFVFLLGALDVWRGKRAKKDQQRTGRRPR